MRIRSLLISLLGAAFDSSRQGQPSADRHSFLLGFPPIVLGLAATPASLNNRRPACQLLSGGGGRDLMRGARMSIKICCRTEEAESLFHQPRLVFGRVSVDVYWTSLLHSCCRYLQ